MPKTILGLDLGITSIGWALVSIDDKQKENNKIIDSGVRIFQIAENPKDGKSLALPRREARGARRTVKRRAQRVGAVKRLLLEKKTITQNELDNLFIGNKDQIDVWKLRKEALDRLLEPKELSRILIHIAKHRGYSSNRKSDEVTDSEGKAVLAGIVKNELALKMGSYRTIGEYMATKSRQRNSRENYENSIARSMLIDEVRTIFKIQKSFGSVLVNEDLLNQYELIAFTQRPMKSVEDMVAMCPFEPKEKRAPKAAHTFEKFRALQKLKNVRLLSAHGEVALTLEQIHKAIDEAKGVRTFTYKILKNKLRLPKELQFKGLVYFDHKTGEVLKKDPEKSKLLDFSAYQKLREAVCESQQTAYWEKLAEDEALLDSIAWVLSTEKDDKASLQKLLRLVDDESVCEALLKLSFSGFGHLSTKALNKIVPYLEDGMDYDKACDAAGYDFKALFRGDKSLLLPSLSKDENREMTNPVVKRAMAQMRLVYNAIARKYGPIDAVHIELTRDIKKSHRDRNEIKKLQGEFQERKEEARTHAIEILGREPNAKELLKFRLWQEQNQFCVYSGTRIEPADIMDPFTTEVDHILPYSRSLDDSLNNKVLCLTKENQNKGNRTPFEYYGADQSADDWQKFSGRVEGMKNLKYAKKSRLLKTNFDASSEENFRERNKNDTSYIAKFVKNYIEAHIAFKTSKQKRHVFTMNGMLTSQLRFKWGVGDKNRENHFHHAEDAIILAFATQGHVKKLSDVSAKREGFIYASKEEKERRLQFEAPVENFHKKVKESIEKIFISFMPRRKVTGAAHEETIYSPKTLEVRKDSGKKVSLKGNSVRNNVKLKHGIAKNDSMPRVDLFQNKETKKFYLVPIYVSDFVKDHLPNKAIVAGDKPWLEMDGSYEFRFSFYKNDLIEIQTKKTAKKEAVNILGYFDGLHSGTGQITIQSHNGMNEYRYGAQNLIFIKKYQVDALGHYVEVKREKRVGSKRELLEEKKSKMSES